MIFLLIGYLVCAFLCHGMTFAYSQKEYPLRAKERYRQDLGISLLFGFTAGMMGPLGILLTLLLTGLAEHGFKVK